MQLRQWDAVRVAPEVTRCFEAGPDGVEFLVFGTLTSEPPDVEMMPGWWTD